MEVGARNFPEAVRELAAECGVEVPESRRERPNNGKQEPVRKIPETPIDIQDLLTSYYSDQLFDRRWRSQAYLQNRGLSVDAARRFDWGGHLGTNEHLPNLWRHIYRSDICPPVLLPPDDGWHSSGPLGGGYSGSANNDVFVVDFGEMSPGTADAFWMLARKLRNT